MRGLSLIFDYVNSELLSDPLKMKQSAYVSFMIFGLNHYIESK